MMKIMFIILMSTFVPKSFISSISLMLIILAFIPLYLTSYKNLFLTYNMLSWDILSISLISLSILISVLMILASISNNLVKTHNMLFLLTTNILLICLLITFSSSNLIMFYIMFEASLIPTFILILGWGYQPERTQAGMYMLMYTIFASLPFLMSLLIWANLDSMASFFTLSVIYDTNILSSLMALTLILAFSVKLPLYMIHLWLPKAHVEAPVAGSMMLAAVLLKLGGYGVIRVALKAHHLFYSISPYMMSWSLTGGVMIAVVCVFQSDIKFLVALSSVAHMAMVMGSALTFSNWGINGAQFIMIGHGFCSSGLFFLANLAYERMSSRSLFLIKGTQNLMPPMAMMWLLLCSSNMAAPPSLNLLGEMSSISSLLSWSFTLLPILAMMVFLAAMYSLFLYSQTQHGKMSSLMQPSSPPMVREWLIALSHWVPLNLMILAPWTIQIIL